MAYVHADVDDYACYIPLVIIYYGTYYKNINFNISKWLKYILD